MTDDTNTAGDDTTSDDTADLSALVSTIESAIDYHQQTQEQLRQTVSALQASIEEHQKSEQKLREMLTHADYLIDQLETELSNDYQTQQRAQNRTETDTQQAADAPIDSEQIDAAAAEVDRVALLEALEKLSADLNRVPEQAEIKQQTPYTPDQYAKEFGSYMSAFRESDLDLEHYVLTDIAAVAEERGTIPTLSEYQTEGRFPQSIIKSLFGSWREGKKELYRHQSLSGFSTETTSYREELIYQLRQLEQTLNHLPAASQINEETWVNHQDYSAEFGSIEAAFEACGFDVEQRILHDINRVHADIGTIPSVSQYKQHGECSVNIVTNHFASWAAAKEKYIHQQEEIGDPPSPSQADESSSSNAAAAAKDDAPSDILDTIVTDIHDATAQAARSEETDSDEDTPAEIPPEHSGSDAPDGDRISEKYDTHIVEAVNANFEPPEGTISPQLQARRQNAAAALQTAINTNEALGRRELEYQFYDEELYTSRGSFWKQNLRPVLQEVGQYDRGEGGYVFPNLNPE